MGVVQKREWDPGTEMPKGNPAEDSLGVFELQVQMRFHPE